MGKMCLSKRKRKEDCMNLRRKKRRWKVLGVFSFFLALSISFCTLAAEKGEKAIATESAKQEVSVKKGKEYRYEDYGYGTFLTHEYQVQFEDVSATAYCVQPSKTRPESGTYKITKLSDGKKLAKVCYYGTKASKDDGFFTEENGYGNLSAGARFILVHLAAAYANNSSDAFSGANSKAQKLAMKLYDYCVAQPEIPDVDMKFSDDNVKAYADGERQRTKTITFQADELQTITMKLPKGVKFHNVTTGKISKAGEAIEVSGGTKFYLSAPITQAEDVAASWTTTMKGSITKDFSAYKITTGSSTQDLALVFGEGVTDEKYVDFQVSWIQKTKVKIVKKDAVSGKQLSGAVFGIYEDAECQKEIMKMSETNEDGKSEAELWKTSDCVYVKELVAPKGYVLDTQVYEVKLKEGATTEVVIENKEKRGKITIYKEGEVLTGVQREENGVVFQYEVRCQSGAVYEVYAAEDIVSADGTTIFQKGELVAENLVTDETGTAVLEGLHLGSYWVKEKLAPENFFNSGEGQMVILTESEEYTEVSCSEITFLNARQKAKVDIVKKDAETGDVLEGAKFGIYTRNAILDEHGEVLIEADTLLASGSTEKSGKYEFLIDLPIGYSYYVEELLPPTGYKKTEECQEFTFEYEGQEREYVNYELIFENEKIPSEVEELEEPKEDTSHAVQMKKEVPKTGDGSNWKSWVILLIFSGIALSMTVGKKKR